VTYCRGGLSRCSRPGEEERRQLIQHRQDRGVDESWSILGHVATDTACARCLLPCLHVHQHRFCAPTMLVRSPRPSVVVVDIGATGDLDVSAVEMLTQREPRSSLPWCSIWVC
jgi:hypothetical protein